MSTEAQKATSSKPTRGKGKPWSKEEDEAICCAWLDVSQDPIVSTNQKSDTMYNRVLARFLEICAEKNAVEDYKSRTVQAIKSRWSNISKTVSKFVGCLIKVESINQSGATPADNYKKALSLFRTDSGGHFNLTHCYVILSIAPKWQHYAAGPTNAPSQQNEDPVEEAVAENQPSTSDIASGSVSRPMGQKRAKIEAAHSESIHVTLREIADSGRRLIELSEKRENDRSKRTESYKRMINHKIMSVDFSKLSPTAQIYYNQQQQKILAESEQEQVEEEQLIRFSEYENSNSQFPENFDSTFEVAQSSQVLVPNHSQRTIIFGNSELMPNAIGASQEDLDALNISYSPEQTTE